MSCLGEGLERRVVFCFRLEQEWRHSVPPEGLEAFRCREEPGMEVVHAR